MSFLYPEEDDLLPRDNPLRTMRTYPNDPEEAPASSPTPITVPRSSRVLSPEFSAAMDKVKQTLGERPERQAPSGWQRLAAGLIGGGAGFINASGRTRIDPRDTQAAVEGVTGEAGFRRRTDDWKRRLDTYGQQAQIEGNKVTSQRAAEDQEADLALKRAHAGAYEGQEVRARALAAVGPKPPDPIQHDPTKNLIVPDASDPTGFRTARTGKPNAPAPARTIEGQALEIFRSDAPPEQKKAQLDSLRDTYNQLHPEKPITHFESDNQGNVTAVSVKPTEVASSPGGKLPLGRIGKTKTEAGSTPNQVLTREINEVVGQLRMKHGDNLEAAVAEAKSLLADDPAAFAGVERQLTQRSPKKKSKLSPAMEKFLGGGSASPSPSAGGSKYKPGDPVNYKGKPHKVLSVNPDGTLVLDN